MNDRIAYPKSRPLSAGGDVEASIEPAVGYARRFTLTVAEEALQKLAPQVIPHVVERLAGQIAAEHRGAVEATVHEYLRDRAWAEPVIREAIRDAVREVVRDMLGNSAFGDMLRARGGASEEP